MKKLILMTIVLGLFAAPALATSTLGWWEQEHPRATFQVWDFLLGEVELDGGVYAYDATTTDTNNTIAMAWIGNAVYDGSTSFDIAPIYDDTGAFVGYEDYIIVQLEIGNLPDPLAYKEIWVDIGYTGILTDISATGVGTGDYTTVFLDETGPSGEADFGFRIYPNPEKEDIFFFIAWDGNIAPSLDYIRVDTICIPAPGAVLLGGIGVSLVGWLKRRRTL